MSRSSTRSGCDVPGAVLDGDYLSYSDVSMTELWRAAFGSYQPMIDRGVGPRTPADG